MKNNFGGRFYQNDRGAAKGFAGAAANQPRAARDRPAAAGLNLKG
jgi:hypothetical protein